MKALYRTPLFLLFLFVTSTAFANAHKKEFTKKVSQSYNTTTDGKVLISNKYGNVNIKTWNKNEVKIDVTVTVKAKDEKKAEQIFKRIKIDFESTDSYIQAITSIESESSGWYWNWGSNNYSDFSIDYEVQMPKSNALDLSNKYGNSNIADLDGAAKIEVKYGDVKGEIFTAPLNLTVGYGKANIDKTDDVDAYVKYGKLWLKEGQNLDLQTKYSKVNIETANDIRIESKYDHYDIGKANDVKVEGKYDDYDFDELSSLRVNAKYSNYRVQELSKRANVDVDYGELYIGRLKEEFEKIDFEGRYSHLKIKNRNNVSFELDYKGDYADFRIPDGFNASRDIKDDYERRVEGVMGNANGRIIKAIVEYGSVTIQ